MSEPMVITGVNPETMPEIYKLLSDQEMQDSRSYGMGRYVKRALIAFFKDYFRDPSNSDGRFQYADKSAVPVKAGRMIGISADFSYGKANADDRPLLVVRRISTGFDHPAFQSGMKRQDMISGDLQREYLAQMSFSIEAYCGVQDEAELLGEFTAHIINSYNDELRHILGFNRVFAGNVGPASPVKLDSAATLWCVSTQVQASVRVTYKKSPKQKKLSRVALHPTPLDADGHPTT